MSLCPIGGTPFAAFLEDPAHDHPPEPPVPALIDGLGTPSVIDGPARLPGARPTRLRALHVEVGGDGTTWAAYQVDPP